MLNILVVLQGRPVGRMREAGGGASPTLVPWEELVRGRINKPEIFQTEVNTLLVELRKRTIYIIKNEKNILFVVFSGPGRKNPSIKLISRELVLHGSISRYF